MVHEYLIEVQQEQKYSDHAIVRFCVNKVYACTRLEDVFAPKKALKVRYYVFTTVDHLVLSRKAIWLFKLHLFLETVCTKSRQTSNTFPLLFLGFTK